MSRLRADRQTRGTNGPAPGTAGAAAGTSGGPGGTSGRAGDRLFLALTAAGVLLTAGFNVLNVLHERAGAGRPIPAWQAIALEGSSALVLLLLAPLVLAFTRRAWPLGPGWPKRVALHAVAACAVSLVHVLAMGALRAGIFAVGGERYEPLWPLFDWPYEFRKDLLVYLGLVGLYVIWRQAQDRGAGPAPDPSVVEVREGARRRFVPAADILWVEAAGNYVELHRAAGSVLHRAPLASLERALAADGFHRIHRSRLVRRSAVAEVVSKPSGDFTVRLTDGRELAGSRRYRDALLKP